MPGAFLDDDIALSGLRSFQIPKDRAHATLQLWLCLELGVRVALGGGVCGGGTRSILECVLLSGLNLRATAPVRLACGRKKGRRQGILSSPWHLCRPRTPV